MNIKVTQSQWQKIRRYALEVLGFSDIAATNCDLSDYIPKYQAWIEQGYHADLDCMTKHGAKRYTPHRLVEGTKSVIMVRLNYLPKAYSFKHIRQHLQSVSDIAAISYYAQGRDYHKVIRKKLKKLEQYITELVPQHQCRVFSDSAPVLEKPLAEKAGLGWIGKNSNLLDGDEGSFFFLGALYSNLDFSDYAKSHQGNQCGKCQACIKSCPTNAITDDNMIDVNKCISYLTIENKGTIPLEFRKAIGNRIYGCDDCQLVCPINQQAPLTSEADFFTRASLDAPALLDLLNWDEATFNKHMEGSAIRRIGYRGWMRNIIIALGNASFSVELVESLKSTSIRFSNDPMLKECVLWSLRQFKS